jgi:hypothetical protein
VLCRKLLNNLLDVIALVNDHVVNLALRNEHLHLKDYLSRVYLRFFQLLLNVLLQFRFVFFLALRIASVTLWEDVPRGLLGCLDPGTLTSLNVQFDFAYRHIVMLV